jgi:hypothetical protein
MCQCYQIGGPFIAEDPDCPTHGTEAQAEADRRQKREADILTRLEELEARVAALEGRG